METTETTAKRDRLAEWIDQYGPQRLADDLGVTHQAVYFWRQRRYRPDPGRLQAILTLAAGRLTVADIYPPNPTPEETPDAEPHDDHLPPDRD